MAFNNGLEYNNCYDNYIYKNTKIRQVPEFDGYNITVRLNIIYIYTIKYSNLLFSSKRDRLLTANLIKNPRITVK